MVVVFVVVVDGFVVVVVAFRVVVGFPVVVVPVPKRLHRQSNLGVTVLTVQRLVDAKFVDF